MEEAGSDNKSLPSDFAISIGEEIVLYGPMYYYNSKTPETANGAYIVTVNGEKTGDSSGDTPTGEWGTKDNPLTVAKALEVINGLADNGTVSPAYVKGKISKVSGYNETYKSITYYISDDGTDNNALQVYSGKGIDGADFAAKTDLEKGWTVIVTGELKKFVNKNTGAVTLEVNQSNQIVSIDKTTGGGGDTPDPGEAKGSGTQADPYNVAGILKFTNALPADQESSEDVYFKGKISQIKNQYAADDYGNATFYISEDGTQNNEFYCFRTLYLGNTKFAGGTKNIKVGDEVIICGKVVNYKGNTPETASNKSYLYSLNGKTEAEPDEGGSGGSEAGSADITAAFGDLDCSDITSIKLSDGTTLSLAQEDGSNYARNSLTINAGSKKINKVELAYDTYNGTAYKGNDEMYGEAGSDKLTPTKDDKNVTFKGVNNSTLKVVNWREAGTTGGTQLRLTGISITYVK